MLKNLKQLRGEKKITQRQLGEAIGVSQQSINKYENYEIEPDIRTLILMADYFETSIDYLVGHSDIRRAIEPTAPFDLNADEARIIDGYRQLSAPQRESLHTITQLYLEK